MKKMIGWILLSVGSIYPGVLALMGIFWLYTYLVNPQFEGRVPVPVWPLLLILSLILFTIGFVLIRRRRHAKEA